MVEPVWRAIATPCSWIRLPEHNVRLVEALDDVDPQLVTVSDAMSTSVYSATPETPLKEVATEMADCKYGSTVIMRGHEVVGIFTTVDACRALASVLDDERSTQSSR
jgi:acetoin utilization protein AcuB